MNRINRYLDNNGVTLRGRGLNQMASHLTQNPLPPNKIYAGEWKRQSRPPSCMPAGGSNFYVVD